MVGVAGGLGAGLNTAAGVARAAGRGGGGTGLATGLALAAVARGEAGPNVFGTAAASFASGTGFAARPLALSLSGLEASACSNLDVAAGPDEQRRRLLARRLPVPCGCISIMSSAWLRHASRLCVAGIRAFAERWARLQTGDVSEPGHLVTPYRRRFRRMPCSDSATITWPPNAIGRRPLPPPNYSGRGDNGKPREVLRGRRARQGQQQLHVTQQIISQRVVGLRTGSLRFGPGARVGGLQRVEESRRNVGRPRDRCGCLPRLGVEDTLGGCRVASRDSEEDGQHAVLPEHAQRRAHVRAGEGGRGRGRGKCCIPRCRSHDTTPAKQQTSAP